MWIDIDDDITKRAANGVSRRRVIVVTLTAAVSLYLLIHLIADAYPCWRYSCEWHDEGFTTNNERATLSTDDVDKLIRPVYGDFCKQRQSSACSLAAGKRLF